jgi:hypothetical protein
MNLYGTDLVVLSACQTALGDVHVGEGVYGLRRAFVLAGAKNLVMSLWRVNDQVTLSQMAHFYRAYGQGVAPAQAMCKAQVQTIAELRARTTETYGEALAPVKLWAPFIVQQTGVCARCRRLPHCLRWGGMRQIKLNREATPLMGRWRRSGQCPRSAHLP